eukprot:GHVU01083322.1.p2 GENE.GHVU01083322.1~~GHVU01083322.1.p2  ORF type:complete len:221 (+),score=39.12 GHVU01083322.1:1804-2466(+)
MDGAFTPADTRQLFSQRRQLGMEVATPHIRQRLTAASVVTRKDGSTKPASLRAAWMPLQGRFDLLQHFILGLACTSATVASVERDHSLLKNDIGNRRGRLDDITFISRMHARQLTQLRTAAADKFPVRRECAEDASDYTTPEGFEFASGEAEDTDALNELAADASTDEEGDDVDDDEAILELVDPETLDDDSEDCSSDSDGSPTSTESSASDDSDVVCCD